MAGHGLVYNAGERIFGASCPLYLFLLSIPSAFHADLSTAAYWIGVTCDLISMALLMWLAFRVIHPSAGVIAGAIYAVSTNTVVASCSGMETSFYVMLMLLVVFFVFLENRKMAALCAGLLAVTRPEGILWGDLACSVVD
jgi:hypothetical protein